MANIGIFGAGYVGLVTGACFADLGHEVVVRDVVPERIELLARGEVEAGRPFLDELARGRRVLPIGRLAEGVLGVPGVRHPAHGGVRSFRAGLAAALTGPFGALLGIFK